ncbi:hypothetical protein PAPYR_10989 [Paratrimastix pyriformis]|uniref:Uncharacterized protein n=1 Tax=Paratrimastix pyriformis TaxID=342808 RepID=A0ABQ8U6K3_9EUKA|nr:hypothetical protein PAPYR_10989 [Paratrimastix pyriformis]
MNIRQLLCDINQRATETQFYGWSPKGNSFMEMADAMATNFRGKVTGITSYDSYIGFRVATAEIAQGFPDFLNHRNVEIRFSRHLPDIWKVRLFHLPLDLTEKELADIASCLAEGEAKVLLTKPCTFLRDSNIRTGSYDVCYDRFPEAFGILLM